MIDRIVIHFVEFVNSSVKLHLSYIQLGIILYLESIVLVLFLEIT
jgi:hypothetical protein